MDRLFLSLALVSTVVPSAAFAQSNDVETVAEPGADPRHPTATVTHVELDGAPGDDVAAAIDDVPGVHSRRTSFGQSAYATIRGSSARQVLVEYEGLRLSPPFGPGFDLGGTALGYDAVSVWRGAAATYRGSGALAGALEFRTDYPRKRGTRVEGSVLHGSHDTYAGRASATVATRAVTTRVGVGGRLSDGDFAFTDAQGVQSRRTNNDHRRGAAFGATELRDGDGWFRAAVFHDQGERGTPGLSEFQTQFDAARLDDVRTAAFLGVGGHDVVSLGAWSVDGSLRGGAQLRGYEYSNPEPFLGSEPVRRATRSTTVAAVADANAWGPTSVLRTAIDARYEDWRSDVETSRTSGGAGTSWEQSLGERWLAVGALRGEVDTDGRAALLPAVGARVQIADPWQIRANVGRTFRAPNLDELYLDLEAIRGNPDLVQETAWLADLGVELSGEWLAASVTGFGRTVDDEILFLPISAYSVEAQNIPGTYAAGVEAKVGVERRPLRASVGYTYTHARFRETNAPVPLQPEHAANAHLEVEPWRRVGLRVWTGGDLRGPITLDPFGNSRDGMHAFWDAGMSVGRGLATFSFVARNLLDDDRAVDSVQQPIPGRTFWASVKLRWDQRAEPMTRAEVH